MRVRRGNPRSLPRVCQNFPNPLGALRFSVVHKSCLARPSHPIRGALVVRAGVSADSEAGYAFDTPTKEAGMLTDVEIRKAKAKDKAYKLYDSGGLFLQVTTAGSTPTGRSGRARTARACRAGSTWSRR